MSDEKPETSKPDELEEEALKRTLEENYNRSRSMPILLEDGVIPPRAESQLNTTQTQEQPPVQRRRLPVPQPPSISSLPTSRLPAPEPSQHKPESNSQETKPAPLQQPQPQPQPRRHKEGASRLQSIPEYETDSIRSSQVRNTLEMKMSKKNNKQSIEVMMEEKFHTLFDNELLHIDKNPVALHQVIRFKPETLESMDEGTLSAEDRTKLSKLRTFDDIKNMMNTKFSFQEGRLSSTLDILAQYMRGQKILYLEAKAYSEFYLYRLMIPTILLSTVCSVISGIFDNSLYASWGVAAASGLNTILLALINYFKLDARAEAHRMTAYSFDQLISECEFTSGKILLSNLVKDTVESEDAEKYDLKYIQHFITLLENKVKEVKQKNQFIIPDKIRNSFPNIYYTNVFALVTQSQIQEMIIINQLKLACNAFSEVQNQIIKGDRREEVYQDYNLKLKQKNELIERILEYRTNLLAFDQVLRNEVYKNKKPCTWLQCCY